MTVRDELTRLLVSAGYAPAARTGQSSTADAFSAEVAGVGQVTLVMQYIGEAVLGAATFNLDQERIGVDVATKAFTEWAEVTPSSRIPFAFEKVSSYVLAWSANSDAVAIETVRGVVGLVTTLRTQATGVGSDG